MQVHPKDANGPHHDSDSFPITSFRASTREHRSQRFWSGSIVSLVPQFERVPCALPQMDILVHHSVQPLFCPNPVAQLSQPPNIKLSFNPQITYTLSVGGDQHTRPPPPPRLPRGVPGQINMDQCAQGLQI